MIWHPGLPHPLKRTRAFYDVLLGIHGSYGGRITVRQMHYQTVSHHGFPNTHGNYRRVIAAMDWLRKAGEIPFDDVEDRNRAIEKNPIYDDPEHARRSMREWYDEDRWDAQPQRLVIVIEKAALAGIVQPVADRWQVPFVAARGYASLTLVHEVADAYPGVEMLYAGDHDGSGKDMSRDWQDRLDGFHSLITVTPIALTRAQVDAHNLPPAFAKPTDVRSAAYIAEHGTGVWELDALPPNVLEQLFEDAILARLDQAAWDLRAAEIEANRQLI